MNNNYIKPDEIEKRSFELIERELTRPLDPKLAPVIMRVIHTTADFEYENSLLFSENAIDSAYEAIRGGASVVTDTNMAKSGINAARLKHFGGEIMCFMADPDVAETAKINGTTRAYASVDKAAEISGKTLIFAIGNAPTALLRLCELIESGKVRPALVIGAPVGFVNVVESKNTLKNLDIPYIIPMGRKGGSTVTASICNALIYSCPNQPKSGGKP